ncbi:MAG: endonuclease III [Actinobacteria bacterium HGW-Actinobacteria-7]|jgi:endonuclease-3|nr:MAG: endonuclease III [Actinobacteria bacterium HGW-Actinobacteria-7]
MAAKQTAEPIPELPRTERERLAPLYAERLAQAYGDPHAALHFHSPYQLLIAVILSAQTTDVGVNKATPALFERYPGPADLAGADQLEVEGYVKSLGFYHQKAKNIIATCQRIVAEFGGEVPDTMEGLTSLPGVARKTANIVLGEAFNKVEGIAVDTHVFRLAHRFGLSTEKDTDKVERDLMWLFPPNHWHRVNYDLITHGRAVCTAKRPTCGSCFLNDICPSAFEPTGWREAD